MIPTELIYLWSLIRPGSVGYIYKFSWYGKWARRHKCHEISKVMSHVHGDPPCLHPCEHGQRESIPGCSSKWASKQNPKTLPSSIFTAYSSRIEIDIQAGVLCSPTMCYLAWALLMWNPHVTHTHVIKIVISWCQPKKLPQFILCWKPH